MEIRTLSADEVQDVATGSSSSLARVIPIEEIDSTFKSQYTGKISQDISRTGM